MNYKLINRITGEETMCSKVVIDGFDYYVSQITYVDKSELFYNTFDKTIQRSTNVQQAYWINKVIATNNPSIDLPKVVDAKILAKNNFGNWRTIRQEIGFIFGYNKSQESHPYSEEDMKSFGKFCADYEYRCFGSKTQEEMLQIWKEQQPKIIYYESN